MDTMQKQNVQALRFHLFIAKWTVGVICRCEGAGVSAG